MPNIEQLSVTLHEIITKEPVVFISTSNSVDSTTFAKLILKLTISAPSGRSISLNLTPDNTLILLKLCESMNRAKSTPLIGHDLKTIFTFFYRVTGKPLILNNVFDLLWYETFLRLESSANDINAAISNFKHWLFNKNLMSLYKNIYQPLICRTLPSIEAFPLCDENMGQLVFSNYHIDGQENGRLSCSCHGKRCFNPHSLGQEKNNLKLYKFGDIFFQYDYKNMEVAVLATMSSDKALLEIINSDKDVYESIFYQVTGLSNHEDARNLGKKMFLPVIYGQSATGLAKSLDISVDQSQLYCNKMQELFSGAFDFVESYQSNAKKHGFVVDIFGRNRSLAADEAYKARNFCIQSPAALICLESLVKLDNDGAAEYRIAFHVHDGYYLACKTKCMQDVYYRAKKILESKTELMPDLRLQVSVKVGKSLDKMTLLDKKVKT
jgi:hypothetical protein